MLFFSDVIILTAIIIITVEAKVACEIKPLEPSGMFLENLGESYVYHQTWSVVTKLENNGWTKVLKFVKACENVMTKICSAREKLFGDDECHHWDYDIEFLIKQIQTRNEELDFFFGKNNQNKRKRKGLINLGGWILNKVFGTMDTEEAEGIYNRLESLETHDLEHIDLMKKQITLIKSNFEQLEKPIKDMEEEQKRMTAKLNKFTKLVDRNSKFLMDETQDLHLQTNMNNIASYILMRLNVIFQRQTDLFTIINSINSNKLHPLVLNPLDITTISRRINSYLSNVGPVLDYQIIKQMIKLETFHLDDSLLLKIKIPLPEPNIFNISKVYVTPRKLTKNKNAVIDTTVSYLMVSNENNETIKLEEDEFRVNCQSLETIKGKNIYLCYQNNPRNLRPEPETCPLVKKINLDDVINPTIECPYKIIEGKQELLVKLVGKNSWYFLFEDMRLFQSTCENETRQYELLGQGIIKLYRPCTFTLGNLLLLFENDMEKKGSDVQFPDFHKYMPTLKTKYLHHINSTNSNESIFTITGHTNYNKIFEKGSKSILDLEREISELENKRRHEKNEKTQLVQFSLGGGLLILIIGLLIIKLVRKYTCNSSGKIMLKKSVMELKHSIASEMLQNSVPIIRIIEEEPKEVKSNTDKQSLTKQQNSPLSTQVRVQFEEEQSTPQQEFKREPIRLTSPKMALFKVAE